MTATMKLQLKKGRLLTRMLPVFVWFAALGAVGVLFIHQGDQVDFTGIVTTQEQAIAVAEAGYIKTLPVRLYDPVKKGDTLAVIEISTVGVEQYNTDLINAQRATAQAELERLKAEMGAAEAELEADNSERDRDTLDTHRRLAVDVEQARLKILEVKTDLEPNRALLKDLELEVKTAEDLFNDKAIASYELQKTQSECEVVRQTVKANEQLLEQAQDHYAKAQLRLDEFKQSGPLHPSLSKILDPLAKAITVQEKLIEEFMRPRDTLVLTAPFDGVVSNLLYKPGQAVLRDIPIMTIVQPAPNCVTAWVPQKKIRDLHVDMPVQIVSQDLPRQIAVSRITHISPSMELLPERMWVSPDLPEWGQVVIIPIQPGMELVPNEIVNIKSL
jgi:multidrug resistance efflux pump